MVPNVNGAGSSLPKASLFSESALCESALGASGPCVSDPPTELSDAELLAATRRLVGRSNRLLASLLAHLAEVEARGIHRIRACSSLYTYCIYELRFSEDEAFRRVSAARLVRRFPVLLDAIAAGELHLTGLLMLGPHLTTENLLEVLARAKHRTKKEIRSPRPDTRPDAGRPVPYRPSRTRPDAAGSFGSDLESIRRLDEPSTRPRGPTARLDGTHSGRTRAGAWRARA